ncbi:Protein involved in initiation of plasmid replication (PDB:2Z9O) [Commensalibacter communis]|uniref:replication initiation protein n=1 Tax=Commensalibacter communis TaxID=2972786 RepID=UPI0022FFA440|nr:replication initiation protein [Commensalibacter communis]CAI3960895.1 Protein involved in initiation of plasmid replication (PDB:2Z9O) [Commensalibacter communis]CAI3961715.1 Protein involved in initiation of plasmid replication (PDB:2Z9O) [Commensalibacter communis]
MNNLPSKNIIISNSVTRAGQGLSLSEKRILFSGLAQLNGKNDFIELHAEEFSKVFKITLSVAYRQLKKATKNIFNRYLTWQIENKQSIGLRTTRWIITYDYFDTEGYVRFKFNELLFPYLFELQSHFTKYKLQQACALRSIYSWRLLELFEQQKQINKDGYRWLKISVDDFNHAMEISEGYKKTFGLLRKKIIEPAIKELSEKDNWIIEWKPIKNGRKVAMLEFTFSHYPEKFL